MLVNNHEQRIKEQISIIIPTYNESQNIINILKSIGSNLPKDILTQAIIVDDNSPDGTGKIVEDYLKNLKKKLIIQLRSFTGKQKMDWVLQFLVE